MSATLTIDARMSLTSFQRHMEQGHRNRLGHEPKFVKYTYDGMIWHTARLCCGDAMPAECAGCNDPVNHPHAFDCERN